MSEKPSLVAQLIIDRTKALEAIREIHPIEETGVEAQGCREVWCPTCKDHAPCETRLLADKGLEGDREWSN